METCWELQVGLQEDGGDLARWAANELMMVIDPTRAEPSLTGPEFLPKKSGIF